VLSFGLCAGYNEQLRISDAVLNQLPHLPGSSSSSDPSSSSSSDGSSSSSGGAVLELSEQAVLYLSHVFDIYDSTRSGVLSPMDLEHMFNRAPVPIYQVRAQHIGVCLGWVEVWVCECSCARRGNAADPCRLFTM
jgi:hypothetical protein